VFGRRKGAAALRAELDEVEALITAHPLASRRVRDAHAVVEAGRSRGAREVDRELTAAGLPTTEELGRAQVAGAWSWWRLHRRRRRLERRIARGSGTGT
jgi:hypothetical protein